MANPQDLIAQLMMAQQQGSAPGSAGMPMPPGGPATMPPVRVPPIPGGPPPTPMPPGGPPPPGTMPSTLPPDMASGEGSDEEMLDNVSNQMGGGAPPPPMSGMKWQNLQEDQQALQADPSAKNVQAFVEYWGEDKLPPGIQQGGDTEPDPNDPGEADENE